MSDRDYYQDNRGRGKGRGRGRGGYHDDRRDHREPAKADQPELNQYRFNAQTLLADLTEELPIWPLSCFCPGVKAPVQLFGGEQRERSFEEMRLNHYELSAQGQEALAV